jgi:glycosyltransferase involved in cell wall biosynthesis
MEALPGRVKRNESFLASLAVICTHPIQYFAPIWRMLASTSGLSIHVFYASDHSVRGAIDEQFGVPVKWDIPVLEGYPNSFMTHRTWLENRFHLFLYDRKDVDDILRNGSFDAVLLLAYDAWLHWRALRAANLAKIPVLFRAEATDTAQVKRSFLKRIVRARVLHYFYDQIAAVLAIGTEATNHYLNHGVEKNRIFFSPYAVDDQLFEQQRASFSERRDEIRQSLGFGSQDFVFMFSGKMVEKKNPLLIAEAFERLSTQRPVKFLAVGDGKLRTELELGMRRCLGDGAVFTGFVNQSTLGKYYTASDAFILPSAWAETWGLVVNEAMIFGLPVIVSDRVGCGKDLVIPGKTGHVFPSGDARALSDAMMKLIVDPDRAAEMGLAGSLLVKNFSVKDAVNGILQALEFVSVRRA